MDGNIEVVKYLVKNGARVDDKDNFNWTPLKHAKSDQHTEII